MGMNPATLSGKLNNKAMFTQDEIQKASDLLEIEASLLAHYFFSKESCDFTIFSNKKGGSSDAGTDTGDTPVNPSQ
jgi:hypothetical protein